MKPLVILGLDGLDPYFVEKHLEELPNLEKLVEGGDTGILESTLPPITAPAWACSFTGRLPERHDRFDFQKVSFDEYGFYHPGSSMYNGREFWSYMSGKAAVADVPGASVREIDGWMVSNVFDVSGDDTYPEKLAEELSSEIGKFSAEGVGDMPEEERREKFREFLERRKRTLDYLIDNKEADVYFSVFQLADNMMHHCSGEKEMVDAYRRCDSALGDIMERDVNIIVLSDHGAVKATRRFSVNTWLEQKGFLEQKSSGDASIRIGSYLKSLALRAGELAERWGFKDQLVRINRLYGEIAGEEFVKKELDFEAVEWAETEAFSYMTGVCRYAGIWINDSRFPEPVVEDRQAKKLEIKKNLEEQNLVEQVLLKENAFREDAESFPDLVVVLEEKVKNDSDLKPNVTGKISSYMHRNQGFVGVHGEAFDLGEEDRDLVDLAPTVLHYLGEEIPGSMDGEVMDIFSEDSEPGSREPVYLEEEVAGLDI